LYNKKEQGKEEEEKRKPIKVQEAFNVELLWLGKDEHN
jgi:hypothetical protein